jgi:hypothetical protein
LTLLLTSALLGPSRRVLRNDIPGEVTGGRKELIFSMENARRKVAPGPKLRECCEPLRAVELLSARLAAEPPDEPIAPKPIPKIGSPAPVIGSGVGCGVGSERGTAAPHAAKAGSIHRPAQL